MSDYYIASKENWSDFIDYFILFDDFKSFNFCLLMPIIKIKLNNLYYNIIMF